MFSVKQYAEEMQITAQEVLKMCEFLKLDAKNADDILSEEDVIMLDNAIEVQEEVDDKGSSFDEEENDDLIEEREYQKKEKNKSKPKRNDQKSFAKKRKEMYKNKNKLKSVDVSDAITYKKGMTVADLSSALNVQANEIIVKLMDLGVMASLNQALDFDTFELIALDYDKKVKKEEENDIVNFENLEISDDEKELVTRPPVVTIMGHVDHGKTTLLDYIRSSNIVSSESGGITQHIGAYQIKYNDKKITFIDTPGHAAFTKMRARGAQITDIVIIIVAADDGVMPQTKEAIDHALSANVPIIVAINKIDKPNANIEKVYTEMANAGITAESWGGDIPFVAISAATGENVNELLDTILAIAEIKEYKANPNRYANGTVVESRLDKKTGSITTLLIQNGTLRLGDAVVVGNNYGKIRTIKNDQNNPIVEAGPSTPVYITGLKEAPSAGDKFMAFETDKQAKEVAAKRKLANEDTKYNQNVVTLEDLFNKIKSGQKELKVILKADVKGSEEAVKESLLNINIDDIKVKIIRSDVGTIKESDIVLANASNAIVIGFNVNVDKETLDTAKEYNVEIKTYTIIYKLIEDIEKAISGMLEPTYIEKITGLAVVKQLFSFSKVGTIAGCMVKKGVVGNNDKVRIIRDGKVIFDGNIGSIQREKNSAKEVKEGFECGITVSNFNDIQEGDELETYQMVEEKRWNTTKKDI